MSDYFGKVILGLLIVFCCLEAEAGSNGDTTRTEPSMPARFFVGWDVSRTLIQAVGSPQRLAAARLEYVGSRWSGAFDFGAGLHQKRFDLYEAQSIGSFARIGLNRLLIRDQVSELGFGFGLGTSQYRYRASGILLEGLPFDSPRVVQYSSSGMAVYWTDFSALMKARIWKAIWLGFELKLKLLISGDSNAIPSYFAPGYGIVQNRFLPGFNYYIFVAISGKPKRIVSTPH